MHTKHSFLAITALAVGLTVAACADAPSAPLAPTAAPAAITLPLASPTPTKISVEGLKWKTPLAKTVRATATIGALGGEVSIPSLGFKLTVPAGAVLAKTSFVVTALPGQAVAYDFEPAGAKFLVPLIASQSETMLEHRLAPVGLSAHLGYFPTAGDLDQKRGVANVTELAPALSVSVLGTLQFPIHHFSGYIVCWGRGGTVSAE